MSGPGSVGPAVAQHREPVATAAQLRGVWRRSLIEWVGGDRDETTSVVWLQGISWYADLRQPVGAPDFAGVRCLRDLSTEHLAWLARQQAFAGQLRADAPGFRWTHVVDLDVCGGQPDAGHLSWDGDTLVEVGRYLPYREWWHRVPAPGGAVAGLRLRDACTGQPGLLVRVGGAFGYARARPAPVSTPRPDGLGLAELVRELDPYAAQDLLDCEVSVGSVTAGGWVIDRSSLPYRVGSRLDAGAPEAVPGTRPGGIRQAVTADVSAGGMLTTRTWEVVGVEGDPAALDAFTGR